MASHRYPSAPLEVEITISSAKDLKNVNWRHGPVKPYAVVWVDPKSKCSTHVDDAGDTSPNWDEKLVLPLTTAIDGATLFIDIVHANADEDTKPLIGSAKVPLKEIVDDVGFGERSHRTLKLRRPSGRPQGKVEAKIAVREIAYRAPEPYYAPRYAVPPPAAPAASYRDPYGYPYAPQPDPAYAAACPPAGYPSYGSPVYGHSPYGQSMYGQPAYDGGVAEKKSSKYGMGTGLAVGAVAGVLGGLAIAEGVDYVEDKIADDAAEKVEEDLEYDDGDDY